jgi:hypothetical protein
MGTDDTDQRRKDDERHDARLQERDIIPNIGKARQNFRRTNGTGTAHLI